MGNTPSNQANPSSSAPSSSQRPHPAPNQSRSSTQLHSHSHAHSHARPHHIPHLSHRNRDPSPAAKSQAVNSPIPSGSAGGGRHHPQSPRRRKSLELPDLNSKIGFTNLIATQSPSPVSPTAGAGRGIPSIISTNENAVESSSSSSQPFIPSPTHLSPPSAQLTSTSHDPDADQEVDHDLDGSRSGLLGNTPPRPGSSASKRVSLTSGTRARSPGSIDGGTRDRSKSPLAGVAGTGMSREGSGEGGIPIPGAKTSTRRPVAPISIDEAVAADRANPYFPPFIPKGTQQPTDHTTQTALVTPGLPNYGHSPAAPHLGGDIAEPTTLLRPLIPSTNNLQSSAGEKQQSLGGILSPAQTYPAKVAPAPAVVTAQHHDHESDSEKEKEKPKEKEVIQEVLVSTLPQGMTPNVPGEKAVLSPLDTAGASVARTAGDGPLGEVAEEYEAMKDGEKTPMGRPPVVRGFTATMNKAAEAASGAKPTAGIDVTSDGKVPTLVTWNGGGKEVFVTGTFATLGWKTRLKMNKR